MTSFATEQNYSLGSRNDVYGITVILVLSIIDLIHNDVTRLDAREECWF